MEDAGTWLDMDETADRLGLSRDTLRKRIARGKVQARRANDGRWRVLVTPGMEAADKPGQEPDGSETDMLRDELSEVRDRAARSEGRVQEMEARLADLSAALSRAEAREQAVLRELLDARRPWLERLIAAWLRRG